MNDFITGQEIKITVPLVLTQIGTADLCVEYPAGGINKKLYIPKNICEPVLVTEIIATGASVIQDKPEVDNHQLHVDLHNQHPELGKKVYTCACGKVYDKPIGKAQCVRRHNKAKDEYKSK